MRTNRLLVISILLCVILAHTWKALATSAVVPGTIDTTFNPAITGTVWDITQQEDGKLIVVGQFASTNSTDAIDSVARLNLDGSFDRSFHFSGPLQGPDMFLYVAAVALQPDGKIVIAGTFDKIGSVPRNRLARLHSDGSLDLSFDPGLALGTGPSLPPPIHDVKVLQDGRIVVRGIGQSLFFFNSDGTVANSPPSTDLFVQRQKDGRAIVLNRRGGPPEPGLIQRLNLDGNVDPVFKQLGVFSQPPFIGRDPFYVLPSDEILLPFFGSVERHEPDGQLDADFAPVIIDAQLNIVRVQSDGKILLGGSFSKVNGTARSGIVRLLSESPTQLPKIETEPSDHATLAGEDVQFEINAAGSLLTYQWMHENIAIPGATNRTLRLSKVTLEQAGEYRVAVRNSAGAVTSRAAVLKVVLLPAGLPHLGFRGLTDLDGSVNALVVQPDGKLLIGGNFVHVNGARRGGIARLLPNYTLDRTFASGRGVEGSTNTEVSALLVQPDGKVLIGGTFTSANGQSRDSVARLEMNGAIDSSFVHLVPNSRTNSLPPIQVKTLALQSDGRILAGGKLVYPTANTNIYYRNLVRLQPNGDLDPTLDLYIDNHCRVFNCLSQFAIVNQIIKQEDGKLILGGNFQRVKASFDDDANSLVRLNSDGTIDWRPSLALQEFNNGLPNPPPPTVTAMVSEPGGKLVIAGAFFLESIASTNRTLTRFNADGRPDSSFASRLRANGEIQALALQPDGKFLMGGTFTTVNGFSRNRIARLNSDGTLDMTFNPLAGPDGSVNAIAILPGGNILIGGSFSTVNGVKAPGLAQLHTQPDTAPVLQTASGRKLQWQTSSGKHYTLEASPSLTNPQWTKVFEADGNGTVGSFVETDSNATQRYYRLKVE